jgi:hypothetical protein
VKNQKKKEENKEDELCPEQTGRTLGSKTSPGRNFICNLFWFVCTGGRVLFFDMFVCVCLGGLTFKEK